MDCASLFIFSRIALLSRRYASSNSALYGSAAKKSFSGTQQERAEGSKKRITKRG